MNTEALEYFIKVYEKKSVTSAAKDLFITPQGLSKTIKQLEVDLKAELFYRGSRGMEATECGELLYARAKHICYLMDDIKKEISIMNGRNGSLSVVVTYSTTLAMPLDMLFGFSKLYTNIPMKLRELPDEYPIGKLFQEEEEADVGFVVGNEDIENCEYQMIIPGEVVLLVSKDHPLSIRDEVSIADLEDEPLVLKAVEAGKEHSFVDKCMEYGFTPDIKYEIGNPITMHRLCEENELVGISIDFVEETLKNDNIKVIKLKEKIPQNIYLVTRKRVIQSKAVSLFRSYIKEFKRE